MSPPVPSAQITSNSLTILIILCFAFFLNRRLKSAKEKCQVTFFYSFFNFSVLEVHQNKKNRLNTRTNSSFSRLQNFLASKFHKLVRWSAARKTFMQLYPHDTDGWWEVAAINSCYKKEKQAHLYKTLFFYWYLMDINLCGVRPIDQINHLMRPPSLETRALQRHSVVVALKYMTRPALWRLIEDQLVSRLEGQCYC